MNNNPKIGVFLCKCGQKIEPLVDLSMLKEKVMKERAVDCCSILPYPCLEPGMDVITRKIRENGLNRVIIAGCESRLMLKKFERQLEAEGLRKGQIDIINLRGHVAAVSDMSNQQKILLINILPIHNPSSYIWPFHTYINYVPLDLMNVNGHPITLVGKRRVVGLQPTLVMR